MSGPKPAILGGEPLRDAEPGWPPCDPAVEDVILQLARDRSWGRYLGEHGEQLSAEISRRHGDRFVHLCSGGTAAVELALRGVGVQPGDEVVLSAFDFSANFANVTALGATPVLIDARPDDAQIDVEQIEDALSEETSAVLVSHLHGGTVDMPRLRHICEEHGVLIVEDVCQMPLASVHGRTAGTWGDVGVLSFGGSKTLTAGRGGALVMSDPLIKQRITLHTFRGNDVSPLSEMQAAVLLPQLESFGRLHELRMSSASQLRRSFEDVAGMRMLAEGTDRPDYYKVGFFYDRAAFRGLSRESFCEAVHAEGVTLSPSFAAMHTTHSRRRFRSVGSLENAAKAGDSLVVLHHPVLIDGPEAVSQVAEAVRRVHDHAEEIAAMS